MQVLQYLKNDDMQKRIRLPLIFLLIALSQFAWTQNQVAYADIKAQHKHFKCDDTNLDSVNLTLEHLLAIDTLTLASGLDDYYYDLGMTYYVKSEMHQQAEYRDLAIAAFNDCVKVNQERGSAYYNLSLMYALHHQLDEAKLYLDLYKKYTKKKYWDKGFIARIEKQQD
jgi:tetratricopeptide (TPR) repeat protein